MTKFILISILALSLTGCATRHYATPVETPNVNYQPVPAQTISIPPQISFIWPVKGNVISSFGDRSDDFRNKGIDIKAPAGDVVKAAADGKVVYSDTKMRGFGITIILDHGNNIQTVYSYNSEIFVKLGDKVKKGDVIARVGSSGRAKEPCLHFEIRKDGEPVNPMAYLR